MTVRYPPSRCPHSYARKATDRRIALQFDGSRESWERVKDFAGSKAKANSYDHYWIETPSGPNVLTAGDYVGFAGPGDFFVIGAENFDKLFDVESREPVP
jgi:hypothetical protein